MFTFQIAVATSFSAQLRASVFLTLHEEEKKNPLEDDNLNSFSESAEGNQVISLFKEFLKFFSLGYTLSVFEPETNATDRLSREKLAKELNIIDSGDVTRKPLICEVLRRGGAKSRMSFERDEHFDLDKILTEKAQKRLTQERKPSASGMDRNTTIENPRRKHSDEIEGSSISSMKISSLEESNKRRVAGNNSSSTDRSNNNSVIPSGSLKRNGTKSCGDDDDEDIEEDIDEEGEEESSTNGSDSILKDEEVTSDRTISSEGRNGRSVYDYLEEVLKI